MTKNQKTMKSVSELLDSVSEDNEFNNEFDDSINRRRVVTFLYALRASHGVSQEDVAKELGCTQSRVSKIENGTDNDLKIGELEAYAKALDQTVYLTVVPREIPAVAKVKIHALAIERELKALTDLAQCDPVIAKGVANFHGEAFFNLMAILEGSCKNLPNNPADDSPYIRIAYEVGIDQPSPPIKQQAADPPALTIMGDTSNQATLA